jgi:hypothetical protein
MLNGVHDQGDHHVDDEANSQDPLRQRRGLEAPLRDSQERLTALGPSYGSADMHAMTVSQSVPP